MIFCGLNSQPLQKTIGIRVTAEEEFLGADAVEHNVQKSGHTSQMTFTSSVSRPPPNLTVRPSSHAQEQQLDTKDLENGEWTGRILTLTSFHNISPESRRSSSSRVHGFDREAAMPAHLAQVYPAWEFLTAKCDFVCLHENMTEVNHYFRSSIQIRVLTYLISLQHITVAFSNGCYTSILFTGILSQSQN